MMTYEGKFIKEVKEKPEPKVVKLFLFEENEATIEYVCNGHLIKEGSTFHEMSGEMTCKTNAIEDAKEIVNDLKLKKNSDLIIQVKVKTYHIKKRKTGREYQKYEDVGYPKTIKEEVVWSSKPSLLTGVKE